MTVIHRKHGFIYLKSKKTAGTALEVHLLTRTPLGNDIWHTASDIRRHGLPLRRKAVVLGSLAGKLLAVPDHPALPQRYLWRFRIEEHHEAASLSKRLGGFWDRALKVTSVRNPWDVMVSGWAWRRGGKGGTAHPIGTPFEEWVDACLSGDDAWRKRVNAYDPRRLIVPFVFVDGRFAVDMVIRQERIDEGLEEVGQRLGISLPPLTLREKTSKRKRDYRTYFTDRQAEAVGDYFADIVSLFDYRFDPGAAGSKL